MTERDRCLFTQVQSYGKFKPFLPPSAGILVCKSCCFLSENLLIQVIAVPYHCNSLHCSSFNNGKAFWFLTAVAEPWYFPWEQYPQAVITSFPEGIHYAGLLECVASLRTAFFSSDQNRSVANLRVFCTVRHLCILLAPLQAVVLAEIFYVLTYRVSQNMTVLELSVSLRNDPSPFVGEGKEQNLGF